MATNYLIHWGRSPVKRLWQVLIILFILIGQSGLTNVQAAPANGNPADPAPAPISQPPVRSAFAPVAGVGFGDLPATPFLGQSVSFSVTFSNTGTTTGYGPFIDLVIPATQGLGTTTITASYQGIPFTNNVDIFTNTFNASNQVTHPLVRDSSGNFITVNAPGTAGQGDKLVTIRLPFGSYSPGQPPISVDVTVNMAVPPATVGTAIPIWARGGYQFGTTPLDDWCCDAPIVAGSWASSTATPTLWTLSKSYSGPEDEAASGPNFTGFYPMQYTLGVDIAPGQTITNLTLSDVVPDNLQPVSWVATNGATCSPNPLNTASPGDTIQCTFASASNHAEVIFDFYVPLTDLGGVRVIDPNTGLAVTSCNNATADGTWNSNPLAQLSTGTAPSSCGHTLNDRSIAIQKGMVVDGGGILEPGVVIKNTLNFQVSDFFAFDNVTILDIVSDGQHFFTDGSHPVTLQINGNGYTFGPGTYSAANYGVACYYSSPWDPECTSTPGSNSGNPDEYGTTQLTFNVSAEIIAATSSAQDGKMVGGCVDPANGSATPNCGTYNDGATSGQIVFYTRVLNNFVDNYPSGDSSVDEGDVLTNIGRHIQGDVLDTDTLTPVSPLAQPQDGSSAELTAPLGDLTKEVYAVNGNTSLPSPVHINPGDAVTYRLTYTLPIGNEENMRFTDYLPLPIFKVDDPDADGTPSGWTFSTTPSTMTPGTVSLGPTDNFYQYMVDGNGSTGTASETTNPSSSGDPLYHDNTTTPNVVVDTGTNSVSITYPNYDDTRLLARTVDLLITVTVNNEPFADQLYLTNEAYSFEGSTNGGISSATKIVQVVVDEPVLVTKKSAIWAGSYDSSGPGTWSQQTAATYTPALPGGNPIQNPTVQPRWSGTITTAAPWSSDIAHVDAQDVVTFMIVIEDQGHSDKGAFDITLKDTLPSIFQIPTTPTGLNLHIWHGDGSGADYGSGPVEIQYTGLGGAPGGTTSPSGDLFGNGIKLTDPADVAGVGAVCQAETVGPGKNVIVITYDLQIKDNVIPGTYPNTAEITGYASQNNGPNFVGTGGGSQDTANTTVNGLIAKELVSSEINNTYNDNTHAVIGEIITYKLTSTVPEGEVPGAFITDHLDSGLAFLSCTSVVASSADVTTDLPDTTNEFDSVCGTTQASGVTNNGQDIRFNLGNITNANRDNSTPETVTITYQAVVLNVIGNQTGTTLNNSAEFYMNAGSGDVLLDSASAANVTVIESLVNTSKSVDLPSTDAGNTVTFTVTLSNPSSGSTTAYDVSWSDSVPTHMTYVPSSLILGTCTATTPLTLNDASAPNLSASGGQLEPGESCEIIFQATLTYAVTPGEVITNTAETRWTSLPGDITDRSIYNTDSDERTGANGVGNGLNNYASQGQATVSIVTAPVKAIVSTSEASTGPQSGVERLVIGEIVRYRLQVVWPEGTSVNALLRDYLPTGLQFLDTDPPSQTKIAFVCDGATQPNCMTSSTLGTAPFIFGDETNVDSITPTYVLPDAAVSNAAGSDNDTYGSGTDVYFKFGNLTNNDNDPDKEYVVIEFNALVMNIAGNQSNTLRSNNFTVSNNGTELSPASNNVDVRVAESNLTVNKAITTTPSDAGDAIVYTLTITNNSSGVNRATAFDLSLSDVLNGSLSPVSIVYDGTPATAQGATCVGPSTAGTTAFTHSESFSTQTANASISCLDPGSTATFVISATLASSVPAGVTIPNTANLTWTSLPGNQGTTPNATGSTTPGSSGASNGERNGSGGVNDYATSDNRPFTVTAPTVSKLAPDPSTYPIGDRVDYYIRVTLPEGLTPSLVVKDQLPAGLGYVSSKVITTVADADNPAAPDPRRLLQDYHGSFTTAGTCTNAASSPCAAGDTNQTLSFTFGDTTTTGSGPVQGSTNNQFLLLVRAQVLNVAGNQPGTTLTNTATLDYLVGSTPTTVQGGSQTVTVIGPYLTLDKQASTLSAHPDAGDTITYTVTINAPSGSNRSNSYDVHYYDTLPGGVVSLDNASVSVSGASYSYADNSNYAGNVVDVTITEIDINETVTITYTATLLISIAPNDTIDNTGELEWTSLPGTVSGERTGTDKDTGGVNDYYQTSTATVTSLDITAEKSIVGSSQSFTSIAGDNLSADAAIGEVLRYRLAVILPEGTAAGFQLKDTLPTGFSYAGNPKLSFVANSSISVDAGHSDLSGANNSAVPPTFDFPDTYVTTSGQDLTFDLGDLVNNDNDSGDELVVLDFDVLVDNSVDNDAFDTNKLTKINNFTVDIGGSPAGTSNDVTATIVESQLTVTKTVSDLHPGAGETVTYTLAFQNTSPSTTTAYDVNLTDQIDSDLTLDLSSIQITPTGWTPTVTANNAADKIDLTFDTIPVGGSVVVTYKATVNANVTQNTTILNTVNLTWTSLPGDVSGERTGTIGGTTAPDNYFATADVTLDVLRALDKFVASGSVPDDGNSPTIFPPALPDVYIGEILNYNIVLTVPPGDTLSTTVTDLLDQGLAFVGCTSITPQSSDLTTSISGTSDFSPACSAPINPTVSPTGSSNPADDGREIVFTLGDLHNANSGSQTLTIAFQAVVLNSDDNKSGSTFSNNVTWDWDSGAHFLTAPSETLTVKEANLQIEKTVDPKVAPLDSIVTFTLNVSHSSESLADAYDALVTDVIPTNLAIVPGSVVVNGSAGLPAADVTVAGNVLTVYWRQFQLGETAEITYTAQFIGPSPVRNTATLQWSSIQIDPRPASQQQSAFNTLSNERRYIPNDQLNDYRTEAFADLRKPGLPDTGFAPGVTTQLPPQPDEKAYTDLGNFWLEIPRLGVKMPIVGVPISGDGWDLTWLWDQAGYLDRTAYPTHAGNSAITAHVYLPDGKPGPFVNLHTMQWGDQVIVHAFGQRYVYEVRQIRKVLPDDLSILKHEDYPWITLITCQGYNETKNSYSYRTAVRAVLVSTSPDSTQP
jgi:LPXTG-site transpeptidase (sortase) family protein